MITFVSAPAVPLSLCQTCWATVPPAATEDHARWHEESAGKDWNEGYAEALTDLEEEQG